MLLVSEINVYNFILMFLLSFIYEIKTCKIQTFLLKVKGRIKILDFAEYFNYEESIDIKSKSVKIWEDMLLKFPLSNWQILIKGKKIDMSLKAKQDLQENVEKLLFFKAIANSDINKNVKIIDSINFEFLSRIEEKSLLFKFSSIKYVSKINKFLERCNFIIHNLYLYFNVCFRFCLCYVFNKRIDRPIKIIYDGVSPRELSVNKEKITFTWLIDRKTIHKKDILFLLPKADFQMKKIVNENGKDMNLMAINRTEKLKFASRKKIQYFFYQLVNLVFSEKLLFKFDLENLFKSRYYIRILDWLPLIETVEPKVYINSFNNIGNEEAVIIYLNSIGVSTVLWTYGTNSYSFTCKKKVNDFRNISFCNIISKDHIVWNQDFENFIEMHPQNRLRTKIIGPLMCGDEQIMKEDKLQLFRDLKMPYDENKMYISFFDCPEVASNFRGNSTWNPEAVSSGYNCAFIKDIYRLLEEFQNIHLVFKPKRSLTSGKFHYENELKEIFEKMQEDNRVAILDYNVNPWIPIALADLCISMPFESTNIAALHYGKIGIFHDPLGIAFHHRYLDFPELITHNFEELMLKVKEYLCSYPESEKELFKNPLINTLCGQIPKENSSDKFREFLYSKTT